MPTEPTPTETEIMAVAVMRSDNLYTAIHCIGHYLGMEARLHLEKLMHRRDYEMADAAREIQKSR